MSGKATDLRKDAQRNRERILTAGRELFRNRSDVPLYEVGKRAGVGQATLYRHFPDRSALIDAICEVEFAGLREMAASRAGDPDLLLVLIAEMSGRIAGLHGLTEAIRTDLKGFADGRREETVDLLAGPLETARAAGSVRPDLEVEDVFRVLLMIEGAVTDMRDHASREHRTERALALVFDGLRFQSVARPRATAPTQRPADGQPR